MSRGPVSGRGTEIASLDTSMHVTKISRDKVGMGYIHVRYGEDRRMGWVVEEDKEGKEKKRTLLSLTHSHTHSLPSRVATSCRLQAASGIVPCSTTS